MCTPPCHSRHFDHQVGRPPSLPHGHAGGVAALARLQHHGGFISRHRAHSVRARRGRQCLQGRSCISSRSRQKLHVFFAHAAERGRQRGYFRRCSRALQELALVHWRRLQKSTCAQPLVDQASKQHRRD